ncbi:MAG: hypothetical protein AAGI25_19255 [Bacteroidota bacterium]
MKCFILKRQDQYSFMFIEEKDLESFHKQHGHQIIIEVNDLQEALIQFGKLPR